MREISGELKNLVIIKSIYSNTTGGKTSKNISYVKGKLLKDIQNLVE